MESVKRFKNEEKPKQEGLFFKNANTHMKSFLEINEDQKKILIDHFFRSSS